MKWEVLRVLPLSYIIFFQPTEKSKLSTDQCFGVLPIPGPGHSINLLEHTDDKRMLIIRDSFSYGTWNVLIIRGFSSVKLYIFSMMTEHAHLIGLYKYYINALPPIWQQNRDQNNAINTWKEVRWYSGISWLNEENKEIQNKLRQKLGYKPRERNCS